MNAKPRKTLGRATLQDVAAVAGVSATTVSLVLSGKGSHRRISEEAHEKVRKAAAELNYSPNLLVRSLRRGRSHIIVFYNGFRHREASDLYMDKLATAIEYAGGSFGYDILIHCRFERGPEEVYQFLAGGMADGAVVFAPHPEDKLIPLLRRGRLPVVLLNSRDAEGVLPSVADTSEIGMRQVAQNLFDLGHRRVACFGGRGPDVRDSDTRIRLLRSELARLGVQVPDEWVLVPDMVHDRSPFVRLMESPQPPTAIFCWHDLLAYQTLEACDELGIVVPERLSIVGYDGLRWPAATSHRAASVQVDLELLAKRGVRVLDQYIEGYDGPLIEETLPVSLSPGTTLGPAPKR